MGGPVLFGAVIEAGGASYTLAPPSVSVALRLHEALSSGEDDREAALRAAVAGWLPLSLASVLFSGSVAAADRDAALAEVLWVGVPEPVRERAEAARAEMAAEDGSRGWGAALAEYRAAYRPGDVLAEPWPLFQDGLARLVAVRAGEALRFVRAYQSARSPDPGGLQALFREAEYERPAARARAECPPGLRGQAGEEWKARKLAEYAERRRKKQEAKA